LDFAVIMSLLRKLLGKRAPARPSCKLTETEALEIARNALGEATPLYVTTVARTERGIEWQIGTATIGSGATIRIDDATGTVVDRGNWGIR
jgi:hypothetical protein